MSTLARALALFFPECAHGGFPEDLAPFMAGATLISLKKPDGGVRPIAIGEVLRRLVGKALLSTGPYSPSY